MNNPHARQKQNEKKALDQVKKKVESKWDELQARVSQMEQVKWPLLVHLTFKMLLGIIGILAWGWGSSHKVHGYALRRMRTLLKEFGQAKLPMQSL